MELLPMLLLFGLLGVMMYFMSRRQRRAQEQQVQLQSSLAVGDRVMTTSGLYGTVTDTTDDATVSIEIAPGVETEWLRAAVREKVGPVVEDDELVEDEVVADETPDSEIRDVEVRDVEVRDETPDNASSLESGKQK
ncbi:preprotein translocase subunit YajC [Actinophytocola xanthii]|uniref:Preprotein translocase subunit YajC n=1 Tax=Actinophytocola xanthii TaxID=1912961 RepID=A0A1Q8CZ07_9PSEU|nr:preprotein translocase subunit YajC [Actinophytocola xanthii]OLF19590.1 preprotein translocase subunit YajC [Actinophytocola xanthii]